MIRIRDRTRLLPTNNDYNPKLKSITRSKPNQISVFSHQLTKILETQIKTTLKTRKKPLKPPDIIYKHCLKIKTHPTLKVTNSDKNTGLTIMHINHYHASIMQHLSDEKTYQIVGNINGNEWEMTMELLFEEYFQLLDEIQTNLNLTRQAYNFLHQIETTLPKFHILPKLHKQDNATRPIIGAPKWITTTWSKWLETELEKYNCEFTIKNSQTLIQKIEHKQIPTNSWLCSADVSSLYTKMDLNILYNKIEKKTKNKFYAKILKFICGNNYFLYGSNVYKQLNGIAMGTNVAVRCANIYLDDFDSIFAKQCLFYSRYIDDIFFIFTGNIEEYIRFRMKMNNHIPNIKLTIDRNTAKVNFLDLTITRNINNQIEFNTYRKPINIYQYLPSSSNHSRATLTGFIFGEMIRHVRNNTTKEKRLANIQFFIFQLLQRGYRWSFIQRIFSKVNLEERTSTTKTKNSTITIPLIIPFYPGTLTKQIQKIIFETNQRFECKYLGIRLLTAFKKTPNILALCSSSSLTTQHLNTISNNNLEQNQTPETTITNLEWLFSDTD